VGAFRTLYDFEMTNIVSKKIEPRWLRGSCEDRLERLTGFVVRVDRLGSRNGYDECTECKWFAKAPDRESGVLDIRIRKDECVVGDCRHDDGDDPYDCDTHTFVHYRSNLTRGKHKF
jgi:hypothetical protein